MILAVTEQSSFFAAVTSAALWGAATVMAAAWYVTHRVLELRQAAWWHRGIVAAVRLATGAAVLVLLFEAIGRVVFLATSLPLWMFGLAGAGAVEGVALLYAAERSRVSPAAGRVLLALRVLLVLLVLLMLAQPVFVRQNRRKLRRAVAVLLDDSLSMRVPDTHLVAWEKLRLADAIAGSGIDRPVRLEEMGWALEKSRDRLATQVEWLSMVGGLEPGALVGHLRDRAEELRGALAEVEEGLNRQRTTLAEASGSAGKEVQDALGELARRMEDVAGRVKAAQKVFSGDLPELAERHSELLRNLGDTTVAIGSLTQEVRDKAREVDAAIHSALPAEERETADRIAALSRLQLARRILRPEQSAEAVEREGGGLLDSLADDYELKVYRFADEPSELVITHRGETVEGEETDLASAIDRVFKDLSAERLAGIILLTDGCHNGASPVEPAARRAGLAGVPVLPLVFGAQAPPRDAAVVSLDVPDVVYAKDTMYVGAAVKLDGLAGRTAVLVLRESGGGEPLVKKTIDIVRDHHRQKVELAHTPGDAGLHEYEVALETFEGEVFLDNNQVPLRVRVSDERTNLLVIEGYPRWEFRYLKNLFAGRDPSVKMQYVLFNRDRVAGMAAPVTVPASVTRDEPQATVLPREEAEWLKFDVVVLGDVPPAVLGPAELNALRRFVEDRGGVLVVLAGPRHMPHAFAGTVLETIVPVRIERLGEQALLAGREDGYCIGLTPEGRHSVVMRQSLDPEGNLRTWRSFPPLYWRHTGLTAKAGARVLAYALPVADPGEDGRAESGADSDGSSPELARKAPLIVVQQLSLGRVMMLCFDRTWRMRYRAGDVHHHKFWGQVMRWATAGKLAAGTNLVKLGTDRARYGPGDVVRVRARILQADLCPLAHAEAAVDIWRGEKLAERRVLRYLSDSPGIYEAQLKVDAPGSYRVELDCPGARAVLASEGAGEVATQFVVDPAMSSEKVELSPDRVLLQRVADLSGGRVAAPWQVGRLVQLLSPRAYVRAERREYVLWSSWPYLLLILGVATVEWLVRRRSALP